MVIVYMHEYKKQMLQVLNVANVGTIMQLCM